MGWNEPPGGNKGKDPWGNRGGDGPPDLDEAFKKLQKSLTGMFGGGGMGNQPQPGFRQPPGSGKKKKKKKKKKKGFGEL